MMLRLLPFALFAVSCTGDETLRAYAAPDATYVLQTIDDQPAASRITLTLPKAGRIAGQAPCNSYHASMTAPYPWFETGPIATTRRACPALDEEAVFLDALAEMAFSESAGRILILSNAVGREMVFQAE